MIELLLETKDREGTNEIVLCNWELARWEQTGQLYTLVRAIQLISPKIPRCYAAIAKNI